MAQNPFTTRVIDIISAIPSGQVATYGSVARLAGNARAARQVARVLHTCSRKQGLPWHRVVNREGRISLKPSHGYEEQKTLLLQEGVVFSSDDRINLHQYHWNPLSEE